MRTVACQTSFGYTSHAKRSIPNGVWTQRVHNKVVHTFGFAQKVLLQNFVLHASTFSLCSIMDSISQRCYKDEALTKKVKT